MIVKNFEEAAKQLRAQHLRLSLPVRLDLGGCCLKCGERGSGNSDAAANEQHRR
jgi:hypothetical protein